MKKTKLTRSLLAACSIVALSAVMYGCAHDGGDDPAPTEAPMPEPEPMEPTPQVDVELPADTPAGYEPSAGEYSIQPGITLTGENLGGVYLSCDADGPACTVTIHADGMATSDPDGGTVTTGLWGEALNIANEASARAERQEAQRMALMTAAVGIPASVEATTASIDAAKAAIMALQMALDGAVDLSAADTAMYQTQLDNANMAVMTAQNTLDTQGRMMTQRTAITSAVTMAQTQVAAINDDSTDSEVAMADSAIAALKAAIEGADDLPEGDATVASGMGALTQLESRLMAAKTSRTAALKAAAEEKAKADAALGKNLYAALGPPATAVGTSGPLANATATLGATGLVVTAADGAGAIPDGTTPPVATLLAGDSAGSLGSWAGKMYAHTHPGTKVKNEAVVYTNQAMPTMKRFADAHTIATATSGDDREGYYTVDETADLANIMAAAFEHVGQQNHPHNATGEAVFTTRGTYQGAPGEYRCAGVCTSTNDGKGSPSALGGTWHFKPDGGAMVSQPDADYLYFGWWVSKGSGGTPTAASAFVGELGDVDGTGADTTSGGDLTGSATYVGKAAGKYAINNVLDGTGHGGHFTADAMLTANFGAITTDNTNGVTGTIDNFRLNDGTEDPGWSVALNRSSAWAADGAITGPTSDATVWSINGSKASASGSWSGTMHDEMPGNAPDGDGSNIPTTVTGSFYSEFDTIGRMVGAFGADRQ